MDRRARLAAAQGRGPRREVEATGGILARMALDATCQDRPHPSRQRLGGRIVLAARPVAGTDDRRDEQAREQP